MEESLGKAIWFQVCWKNIVNLGADRQEFHHACMAYIHGQIWIHWWSITFCPSALEKQKNEIIMIYRHLFQRKNYLKTGLAQAKSVCADPGSWSAAQVGGFDTFYSKDNSRFVYTISVILPQEICLKTTWTRDGNLRERVSFCTATVPILVYTFSGRKDV